MNGFVISPGQFWFQCADCLALPPSSCALRGPCPKCLDRTREMEGRYDPEFFRRLNSGGIDPSTMTMTDGARGGRRERGA